MILVLAAVGLAEPSVLAQTPASASGTLAGPYDPRLPNVVVVGTSIAAASRAGTLANLRVESMTDIDPRDTSDAARIALAVHVDELLAMPDVSGVVIALGPDAIDETAYFLNLVVKSDKPVVVTAATRTSDALTARGARDLYDAVAVAGDANAYARGVLVVLDDSVHAASAFTGASTSPHAARHQRSGLTGVVAQRTVDWHSGVAGKHGASSEFSVDDATRLPRVDIIVATATMDATPIDAAVAAGAKGLVIVDTDGRQLPRAALDALATHAKRGIVYVRTSGDPRKARVLLRVALLNSRDPRTIQRYFAEY